MQTQESIIISKPARLTIQDLPEVNFSHILKLSDRTGIMQHALYDIPNRKEGYCIDDNSRALLLMILASGKADPAIINRLLPVYLGFIHYMQNDNGTFRNFMCYDKACHELSGSEDSFGRTIMALGYLVSRCAKSSLVKAGEEILNRSLIHCDQLISLRAMASSIIGLCEYCRGGKGDEEKKAMAVRMADRIVKLYEKNKEENWHWFEPIMAYDNAMMPLALFHAYELTYSPIYFDVANESLKFLESKVFYRDLLRPIGNKGWLLKGATGAQFDQQGIDATAMILCYCQVYKLGREKKYLLRMVDSYRWFLGHNDLELSLYDPETGGCADGLQESGINYNQGAESTLAYWIAHMIIADII